MKNSINDTTLITAHISDLHFGAMDPNKQYQILKDQFIEKIRSLPRLDLVCIDGDLFDRKFMTNSDVVMYASMLIADIVEVCKLKQSTFILLQGTMSHDANQVKIYLHYMYREDVDVRVVTNIRFEMVKGFRILCIPELYGIDENFYQDILYHSGFYDLCIMHGTIKGSVYGDNVGQGRLFTIEDFLNCKGPIISGHIHKPDTFNNHFYYCGSPYRWRFDDDHIKGFILMSYNQVTRAYYLDYEEIFSDIYRTIMLEQLIKNDPVETINYIRHLKVNEGIDYIRIKFTNPILDSTKMALNNTFRTDDTVTLEFFSQEKEIARQAEEKIKQEAEKISFLLDPSLTDEQKFVMWVNYLKQDDKYLTVEELEELLKEGI